LKTKKLTLTAIFLAIIFLFALTPVGFINLVFIKATIVHVPVIIGSIVLGPKIGALLGAAFGGISIFINTTTPSLLSFAFSPFIPVLGTTHGSPWAVVIALVPRILTGILPFFIYRGVMAFFKQNPKRQAPALFAAGIGGSAVNTLLVMNLIYFLFKDAYAQARGIPIGESVYKAVLTVIFVNGVPEALVAGIAAAAVGTVLLKLVKTT